MRMPGIRCLAVLTGAMALFPVAVRAQGGSVAVFVSNYSPTQDLFQVGTGGSAGNYRLQSGSSRGAALGVKLNQRVGVVISGGEVSTAVAFTSSKSAPSTRTEADLKHGSIQGSFGLTSGEGFMQPYVSVGLGYVQRGGEAFSGQDNLSSYGLALGAGLQVRVSMLAVTLGAEVMDYSATYDLPGQPARYYLQRDAQLRLGAGLAFGR